VDWALGDAMITFAFDGLWLLTVVERMRWSDFGRLNGRGDGTLPLPWSTPMQSPQADPAPRPTTTMSWPQHGRRFPFLETRRHVLMIRYAGDRITTIRGRQQIDARQIPLRCAPHVRRRRNCLTRRR
jgi:hypothetical protein